MTIYLVNIGSYARVLHPCLYPSHTAAINIAPLHQAKPRPNRQRFALRPERNNSHDESADCSETHGYVRPALKA